MNTQQKIRTLIAAMTLEEKASLCSGADMWHFKGIDRLQIPSVMVSDGPHGLRKQEGQGDNLGINDSLPAVCFPPAVLSACSFDRQLMESIGDAIGQEAQASGIAVVLGPGVNIKRSPLCGRNFEYYSEDPYLSGELAAAYIRGVQKHHVGASLKHFAANNQEECRMTCSSRVDERTLREIYLPAFEKAVRLAKLATVMCSYNLINGVQAAQNTWLLHQVLRQEWGFKGLVVSDWGAVNERVPSLAAGTDVEMPGGSGVTDQEIVNAVQSGQLDEAVLDQTVERILALIFEWTDHREKTVFDFEKDHQIALHAAEESMVLLKNEQALPLKVSEKILFIGDFACHPRYQGGGSSHVNSFRVSNALEAARAYANVRFARGFPVTEDAYDESLAQEALNQAESADKVVVFAGLPESFESEGYDRKHMDLPACQNRLISELAAVNRQVIVVLHNGAPVAMPWLHQVSGILEAYLGGQAGGEAVAHILFGAVNPSGKLAESFPVRLEDNPAFLNFGNRKEVEYREGVFVGYRYYDKKKMAVNFPFGHGLSYTRFEYSGLETDSAHFTPGNQLKVTFTLKNVGHVPGKEIAQLYVRDLTGRIQRPEKELKGFKKIELLPGEEKRVSMTLDDRSFSWYSTELQDWFAFDGPYEIQVCSSSRDVRLRKTIQYTGNKSLPVQIYRNTTIGELLENIHTEALGRSLRKKLVSFFSHGTIEDDEEDKMAESIPMRDLLGFGILSRQEFEEIKQRYSEEGDRS